MKTAYFLPAALVMGTVGAHAINVSLYSKMPYGSARGLSWVRCRTDAGVPGA